MRTSNEPDGEPGANQGQKKRNSSGWGVRKMPDRIGRPNPYGVQWREMIFDAKAGKLVSTPKTLYFPTKATRDGCYNEKLGLKRAGMLVESVSRDELADFRAFKAAAQGVPWQVILAGYHENLVRTGRKPCTLKVETAVTDYLAHCKKLRDNVGANGQPDPKLAAGTYRHKEQKLTLFADQFGDLMMDGVPPAEIESWVDDFDEVQADGTFDNYLKQVSALYNFWIDRKSAGIRDNPCDEVKRRHDGIFDPLVISVAQTAQLFHTALTYRHPSTGELIFMPMVGRLALEAFVGLRFSSGCRITKDDINFSDKGILLPKKKLKTGMVHGGRQHYIDKLPPQIWDWLTIAPAETWTIKPREYMGLKSLLFRVATVPHPHNCLRHGFATYDMRAHGNPGRTATILCHRDQRKLWDNYLGARTFSGVIVTEEMGKLYQTITPQRAEELARGFEPYVWPQSAALLTPAPAATSEDAPQQVPA